MQTTHAPERGDTACDGGGKGRWVEGVERTGGGVSGVGKARLVCVGALALQQREAGARHDHLDAHLKHSGGVRLAKRIEPERDGADGAEVRRDVVAGNTVAAGGAAGEQAILKTEANRDAVGLGLDEPLERLAGQGFCTRSTKSRTSSCE